jgi:hypothetical protein
MPEPIIERLSQFTPDGSSLDRDALLFAAGRASVRPSRGWMAMAGLLAASQVMTLALFWLRPAPPAAPGTTPVSVATAVDNPRSAHDTAELGTSNHLLLASKDADLPPTQLTGDLVPDRPLLHAFAASASSGLE